MFTLPKHYEQFKAQLPTNVDKCLSDIRLMASWLRSAEESGNHMMVYDIENILTHLRYRYLILTSANDAESQAFKLLYEVELPEMIFHIDDEPITFGEFTVPIDEVILEIHEAVVNTTSAVYEVLDEEENSQSIPLEHVEVFEEPSIELVKVSTLCPQLIRDDEEKINDLAKIAVERKSCKQLTAVNGKCIRCVDDHKSPIVFGSAFEPTECARPFIVERGLVACEKLNKKMPFSPKAKTEMEKNFDTATDENIIHLGSEVDLGGALLLHLQNGRSLYGGADFLMIDYGKSEVPRMKTLRDLAQRADLRGFLSIV